VLNFSRSDRQLKPEEANSKFRRGYPIPAGMFNVELHAWVIMESPQPHCAVVPFCRRRVEAKANRAWDGKTFVVHADQKLTASLESGTAICLYLFTERI
jgi:hypothetical protein